MDEGFETGRAVDALRRGSGVVQRPEWLVADDIARGLLVAVLPEWVPPSGLIHAVFPSRRDLVPAVRKFIDFLAAELTGVLWSPQTAG